MSRKNLLWLTLDSIRADRTSIGGHHRDTTPTLARVGARSDGVADTCYSHAIWSQPSVASIMTGTYPSTHGSGSHNETLPEAVPTVAERLSDAGYHTVGLSSNPYFSPMTGTDRGFDRFDFLSGLGLAREAGLSGLVSFARQIRTFSGGFELDKRKHDSNLFLTEILKKRVRTAAGADEPFFIAAHCSGAHHPYYPSPKFRTKFGGTASHPPGAAAELSFEETAEVYSRIADEDTDAEVTDAIRTMYDATVAQVDALVDQLLNHIDRLGIGDDTIVVVTSDHGDLLDEMGLFSHKLLLHDALIEVPLAVRGSALLANAEVGLGQHADVMVTLLSELGVDTTGMQGVRLDRETRDKAVAQRGAETHRQTVEEVREHNPDFSHDAVLSGFVTALRTDRWKYVTGDDEEVLYDLPSEEVDVAGEHPETVDRLRASLDDWMADHGQPASSDTRREFDEGVKELLSDLGYIVDQ